MNSSAAATLIRLVRESFRDTHLCKVFRPFNRSGLSSARNVPLRAPCGLKSGGNRAKPKAGPSKAGEPNVRQLEPCRRVALLSQLGLEAHSRGLSRPTI